MLVLRYFFFAGAALLAFLFAADAYSSKPVAVASTDDGFDRSIIRIHSDRKLPERVVFDTNMPIIAAAPAAPSEASSPAANAPSESPVARVRETFAQFVPPEPKKPQPKVRAVKSRRLEVAQHQRLGVTADDIW
jgi:hypothetical protein